MELLFGSRLPQQLSPSLAHPAQRATGLRSKADVATAIVCFPTVRLNKMLHIFHNEIVNEADLAKDFKEVDSSWALCAFLFSPVTHRVQAQGNEESLCVGHLWMKVMSMCCPQRPIPYTLMNRDLPVVVLPAGCDKDRTTEAKPTIQKVTLSCPFMWTCWKLRR